MKTHHFFLAYFIALACVSVALIAADLPAGDGGLDKLTAAGNLLHLVDSFVFTFGARILAGLCVLGAGWHLKEQRFALAVVCVLGAIMIGTAPMWIANIFSMSDSHSIFK